MNSQTERDVAEKEELRLMRSLQRIGLGTRAPAIKMGQFSLIDIEKKDDFITVKLKILNDEQQVPCLWPFRIR
jgi:hypothetical protein